MHYSANHAVGNLEEIVVFFHLSETDKTTLSTDSDPVLVGDDEHGRDRARNFKCRSWLYAKTIDLKPESQPDVHATKQKFASAIENMVYDKDQRARLYRQLSGAISALFLSIKIYFKCFRNLDGWFSKKYYYADLGGILVSSANFKAGSRASGVLLFIRIYIEYYGHTAGCDRPEPQLLTCFGALSTPLLPEVYSKLL